MVAPAESEELPKANMKRIIKAKLAELTKTEFNEVRDVAIQKEAHQAFAESTRLFVHYLSATANDICRESKRQTINSEDVLRALEDLEFKEYVEPLRPFLEVLKTKKSSTKKYGATPAKRKATPVTNKGKGKARMVDVPAVRSNEEAVPMEEEDEEDEETM